MRSVPPDSGPLDDSWALEEAVDLEATQPVDSEALLALARLAREEHAPPHVKTPPAGFPAPPGSGGKGTLPPPIPVSDYVSKRMVRRPHSSSEITAVQRARPPEEPEANPPPAPSRRTIPWEPPPVRDAGLGRGGSPRETPRLGLELSEPGVSSRPGGRMGFGALSDPDRLDLELDEEFLRHPSCPFPPGTPDLGSLQQAGTQGLRVPHSSGAREPPRRPARDDKQSGIDFRLDLGLGFDEPSEEDLPPMTPPPGTLRYGLLEEDDDFGFRGGAGPFGEAHTSKAPGGLRGGEGAADPSDADQDQATAPGFDIRAHLRSTAPRMEAQGQRAQMQQRFDQGDFSGALVLAEGLLEENPDDAMARRYADSCVEALRQMYKSRLGDGSRVLRLAMPPDQLRSLSLDHRAGFLLSCIDGSSSIDEILDVSGMQTLEALRILYELVQEGVVCDV